MQASFLLFFASAPLAVARKPLVPQTLFLQLPRPLSREGENFKVTTPPALLLVEAFSCDFGSGGEMPVRSNGLINLLHSSYCLLFLHLPPLVLKIIEFVLWQGSLRSSGITGRG